MNAKRLRAIRHGLSLAGIVVLVWIFGILGPQHGGMGYDAFAYWDVRFPDLYGRSFGQLTDIGAFRYSPVVGVLMVPFHALAYWQFLYFWTIVQVLALVWIARRWSLAACAWIGIPIAIFEGNIDLLIALAVVVGLRHPSAWAFPLLTKTTSGVGLLWFAVRREWRSLGVALAATGLIAAPTIVLWPGLWGDWLRVLADNAQHSPADELLPLALRLPVAATMTIYAARTDRPWMMAIAVSLAQPAFALRSTAVAVAAIALWSPHGGGMLSQLRTKSGPVAETAAESRDPH